MNYHGLREPILIIEPILTKMIKAYQMTHFANFKHMKNIITTLLIFGSIVAYTQNDPLPDVLKDQFDAFNTGDIERLVANISDDFKWFYITSDTLLLEVRGKEAFRKGMESYFSAGVKVNSAIKEYAIEGNRISFKEVVSHKNKKGELVSSSAMGIYELKDEKIFRAWYFIN